MMKKVILGIIMAISYMFIVYFAWVEEVRIFDTTYWNYGRYRMWHSKIRDISTGEGLEEWAFSTEWKFPYLYIYGITGYTKVTTIPFFNKVEKLPNKALYAYNEKEPPYNDYQTTLFKLKKAYGNKLLLYDSFTEFAEDDQLIFERLEEKGLEWLNYRNWRFVEGLKELR